jgi:hypothetical protein
LLIILEVSPNSRLIKETEYIGSVVKEVPILLREFGLTSSIINNHNRLLLIILEVSPNSRRRIGTSFTTLPIYSVSFISVESNRLRIEKARPPIRLNAYKRDRIYRECSEGSPYPPTRIRYSSS